MISWFSILLSALAGKPGVYAEVTTVLDWIKANSDHTNPVTEEPIPTGCAIPNWYNDNWCDDGNNIAECNWDGGDCCPSTNSNTNLNQYCTTCGCLDPSAQ